MNRFSDRPTILSKHLSSCVLLDPKVPVAGGPKAFAQRRALPTRDEYFVHLKESNTESNTSIWVRCSSSGVPSAVPLRTCGSA